MKAVSSPTIFRIVGKAIASDAKKGIPASVIGVVHGYDPGSAEQQWAEHLFDC
jgi:hypothetical protein